MLDVSVIILTYNEEIHIRRCLENVNRFASNVFVVDCFSTDKTVEIAKSLGANVIQHAWPGNQAEQFNWALKNLVITTKWILRLDADEYLMPELIEELNLKLPALADDVTGVIFNRRHIFMGKWMKRGIYPVKLLRLFQTGKGVCEQRLMDEHIQLLEGRAVEFEHDFCDHNLNDLSWFCHKHVNYAIREAVDLLDIELDLTGAAETDENKQISAQALSKRMKKHKYAKQPLFWRSFAYFCYRYFLKRACLDGKIGFIWTFLQGWWYRTLVDAKVFEIKQTCGTDKERIKRYLKEHYNISL
ncbi:glycosyltransferase family 2 protein [Phocaeicola sp.]|uniref:glycosyltransferase family 2 protein n=1 Tax=Phocaeicola sp. TaxID=2773926 RepID=UPI003AB1A315